MKYLPLLLLVAVSAPGLSQSCDSLLFQRKDKYNPTALMFENRADILIPAPGKDTLMVTVSLVNGSAYLSTIVDRICVGKGGELIILLDDKSTVSLFQYNGLNCQGASIYWLSDLTYKEVYDLLLSKTIEGMRIHSAKSSIDYDVPPATGKLIKDSLGCLAEKSKLKGP